MRTILIALALLTASPDMHVVKPNRFDPLEMPSEAVFREMGVCFNHNGGFREELVPVCACLIDGIRWNIKQKKPPAATPEQVRQCNSEERPKQSGTIDL